MRTLIRLLVAAVLGGVAGSVIRHVVDQKDNEEAGELVKAFIVRAPDTEVSAETLQAFVAEHVATYKRVSTVEFIDAIPKSASGKILRRELRDR